MIDTHEETLVTLARAARLVPGRDGTGVHVATVWRWATRGVRGARLATVVIGGTRYTSHEALDRFTRECSGDSIPASVPSKAAERRIARAERDAVSLGV